MSPLDTSHDESAFAQFAIARALASHDEYAFSQFEYVSHDWFALVCMSPQ